MSFLPSRHVRALVALCVLSLAFVTVPSSAGPPGYRVARATSVTTGLVHLRLESSGQRIHVARIAPHAAVRPLVAVAKGGIGPERGRGLTSTMCAVRDCLVGVNGDFFSYGHGRPAGAVVVGGEVWITRRSNRPHLIFKRNGGIKAGRVSIPIELRARYLHEREDFDELTGNNWFRDHRVTFDARGINSERRPDAITIFTPRRGPRTETTTRDFEIVARFVTKSTSLRLQRTSRVKLLRVNSRGNARIPSDGVVLSGRGKGARTLRTLWADVRSGAARPEVQIKVGGPGAEQMLGGRPILVRNGVVLKQASDSFSVGRHARTMVGWAPDGTIFLVTVDQGRGARGMSLDAAARLMRRLGAEHAINLDGGGSSTFVRGGQVRNHPSAGAERRIASSLLIVPSER